MHRDLKPENILVKLQNGGNASHRGQKKRHNRDSFIPKISDFGWSAIYKRSENRETVCGTFEYMAPEIF